MKRQNTFSNLDQKHQNDTAERRYESESIITLN